MKLPECHQIFYDKATPFLLYIALLSSPKDAAWPSECLNILISFQYYNCTYTVYLICLILDEVLAQDLIEILILEQSH